MDAHFILGGTANSIETSVGWLNKIYQILVKLIQKLQRKVGDSFVTHLTQKWVTRHPHFAPFPRKHKNPLHGASLTDGLTSPDVFHGVSSADISMKSLTDVPQQPRSLHVTRSSNALTGAICPHATNNERASVSFD